MATSDAPSADFFISRAGPDAAVARMIASILRKAGRTPFYQDEDFTGASFMRMMEQGYAVPRMLALLSPAYQASEHCRKEYNHHLADDPNNIRRRLIVLRIGDARPTGNLKDIGYVDLLPLLAPLDVEKLAHAVRIAAGIDQPRENFDFAGLVVQPRQILHAEIRAVPSFTGREDLIAKLDVALWGGGNGTGVPGRAALKSSNSGAAAGALTGLGGVGTSSLAQQYAWDRRERYEGVWWLRAETREAMLDDLIDLGARYIVGLREVTPPEAAARKTLEHLAQAHAGKPWLLVYDNAENADVMDWTPVTGAHVLVTSRAPDWFGHAAEIDVGAFPRAASVAFLTERARGADIDPDGTRAAANALAADLGDLPLALAIARAHAWGMNWTLAEYRGHLATQMTTLLERDPSKSRAAGIRDYDRSIAATFDLAIARAAATAPMAEKLLGLCAFLAPDRIPLDLFPESLMPPIEKGEAVAALAGVSLVSPETLPDGTGGVSVHRLVQAVMRARLGERAADVAAEAVELVAKAFPTNPSDVRNWPACEKLADHAIAVLGHVPDDGKAATAAAVLANQLGQFAFGRATYSEAEPLMRRALAIDKASFGPDHPNVAIDVNNLAQLLQATNRFAEAEPLIRRALAIDETSFGPDHPEVATVLNNLALLLQDTNRLAEAEPMMRRAHLIFHDSLGPDHPNTKTVADNLAALQSAIAAEHPAAEASQALSPNPPPRPRSWLARLLGRK